MATAPVSVPAPHPTPEAEEVYRRWLKFLDEEFIRHCTPERRAEIVRDQLYQLYLGRPFGGKFNASLTSELPGAVMGLSLDPANVTLEAEYFPDVDAERYARRKPLIWFWHMFDRSPIGINRWLGIRFRCMLGRHIFERVGSGVCFEHGVDITFGYNLSLGDGAVIRKGALLSDRGGISIGKGAVIGSFARIFSHNYTAQHGGPVRHTATRIGDGARVGSHAIILAGTDVPDGATVGSFPSEGS